MDNINDVVNDITELSYKIAQTVKETDDEFIFETIQPFCEDILQRKINKKDLSNLLVNNNAGYERGFVAGYNEGKKFEIQEAADLAHKLCEECYGNECGDCRIVEMAYDLEEKLEKME